MKNNKIKIAIRLQDQLKLYSLSIERNLEMIRSDLKRLDATEPETLKVFSTTPEALDQLVKEIAETLETIFLKTRYVLGTLELDTIAQERLEGLGVNFDLETLGADLIELQKTNGGDKNEIN